MRTYLFVALAVLLASAVGAENGCDICKQCVDCLPEIMTDRYVDEIHTLLMSNIESLGFPLRIRKSQNGTDINYSMMYSSGLSIELVLHLSNMQIELLSYNYDTAQTTAASMQNTTYRTGEDGWSIINDFSNHPQVQAITRLLA
jgi:hypothetical protein